MSAGGEDPRPSCGMWRKAEPPTPAQPSLVDLLRDLRLSERQELFFMQLPDCMPARASAQSTDGSLGSPTSDRRTGHLHGPVSNSDLSVVITPFTGHKHSRTEGSGAWCLLVLTFKLLKHLCVWGRYISILMCSAVSCPTAGHYRHKYWLNEVIKTSSRCTECITSKCVNHLCYLLFSIFSLVSSFSQ